MKPCPRGQFSVEVTFMVTKKLTDWYAGLTKTLVHEEKNLAKRVGSTLCGPNFFLSEDKSLKENVGRIFPDCFKQS